MSTERLAFGYGSAGGREQAPGLLGGRTRLEGPAPLAGSSVAGRRQSAIVGRAVAARDKNDWAYLGLMAFTALLFFRPQDTIPTLGVLHLAELAALSALGAMVAGRLGRGQTATRVTPELVGVVLLGGIILGTAPFSVWMGGAVSTFTELYVKVILIFILMVNTLNSSRRLEQFTTLIVIASGYIAFRAVFDFVRGVNLVENGRVQGSVGGMFKNPNDLALNMVAVLPLAASLALRPLGAIRRLAAAGCAVLMVGAVVATQSRSGTLGLGVMAVFLGVYLLKRKPGLAVAGVLAMALAIPMLPASYWHRLSSITDESKDDTGSAEARKTLLRESFQAFVTHPLTGVGAGQFKNYNPEGREEAWRETHNVVMQVSAELGVFGLLTFGFLVGRAAYASFEVQRLLRRVAPSGRRRGKHARFRSSGTTGPPDDTDPDEALITPEEKVSLDAHAGALSAALAGWFICALFASVAYHWTFYYLLALALAPREILADRLRLQRTARAAGAEPGVVAGVRG